ncbi:MAG: histidinol-phosphate transaminase [Planctomycetes bacterium]|nr:histidinol-phosphate transaminase [Planctomycetota bacterium]
MNGGERDVAEVVAQVYPAWIRAQKPYGLSDQEGQVKLNQNESPFDLPLELKREILERVLAEPWNRYPALRDAELHAEVAAYFGVRTEQLLIGPGSNSLLGALAQSVAQPGAVVVAARPSFGLYASAARASGNRLVEVGLGPDLRLDIAGMIAAAREHRAALVFAANPNNPTGTAVPTEALLELVAEVSGLVLVDEAYLEFSGLSSVLRALDRHPNLIVLRTFSKAFGLAGVRCGCFLGHPEVLAPIDRLRAPFALGPFVRHCIRAILRQPELLRRTVEQIIQERERVLARMSTIPGVVPRPSMSNFVLFEVLEHEKVYRRLHRLGITVRDVSGYDELKSSLRVTIGTPEENEAFLNALAEAVK